MLLARMQQNISKMKGNLYLGTATRIIRTFTVHFEGSALHLPRRPSSLETPWGVRADMFSHCGQHAEVGLLHKYTYIHVYIHIYIYIQIYKYTAFNSFWGSNVILRYHHLPMTLFLLLLVLLLLLSLLQLRSLTMTATATATVTPGI